MQKMHTLFKAFNVVIFFFFKKKHLAAGKVCKIILSCGETQNNYLSIHLWLSPTS